MSESPDDLPYVNSRCIFIGGYSRTGTTMMQGLICKSAETIGVTREAWYLMGLVRAYSDGLAAFNDHTRDYFSSRHELRGFHRELIDRYLERVAARFPPGRRIVQKVPLLTMYFAELGDLAPNARFVVMVRDPRDVAASQLRRARSRGTSASVENMLKNHFDFQAKLVANRSILSGRLAYVRYERLVRTPVEILAELGHFLELSLAATSGDLSWPSKRGADEESSSPLDGKPATASRVGAYRGFLDPSMVGTIETQRNALKKAFGFDVFAADDEAVSSNDNAVRIMT